jgi:TonB family protein
VVVRVTVDRDGAVLSVMLARGSGSNALDEAAQAVFRNGRLPAFTADMVQDRTTVTVPIHYRLVQ